MQRISLILVILFILPVANSSLAQKIPLPSRTVFKCEGKGKVVYSDSPCLGAKRVNIQPTRGLNKGTGTEKIGTDVRQERQNEQMAEAWRPLFAESPVERAKRHHRASLKPESHVQCGRLDQEISAAEQEELRSTKTNLPSVQIHLFRLRQQYRNLHC